MHIGRRDGSALTLQKRKIANRPRRVPISIKIDADASDPLKEQGG